eukprot:SAG22_NODE_10370_length_539_cov_0.820455_1_plen_66_part_01
MLALLEAVGKTRNQGDTAVASKGGHVSVVWRRTGRGPAEHPGDQPDKLDRRRPGDKCSAAVSNQQR